MSSKGSRLSGQKAWLCAWLQHLLLGGLMHLLLGGLEDLLLCDLESFDILGFSFSHL